MGQRTKAKVTHAGQSICLAFVLALSTLLPVKALAQDATDAMFSACVQPGLTAEARLNLMNDAGWRTAGDTPVTRRLLAITDAIRWPIHDDASKRDNLRASVLNAVSTAPDFAFPPDQPLALDDVLAVLGSNKVFETFLVHPEGVGLTRLIVTRHSDGPDRMILGCKTVLTAPHGDGKLDGILQFGGTSIVSQTPSDLDPGLTTTKADRNTGGEDGNLRLWAQEFAPSALHNTVFTDANLGATISLYVDSIHGAFSLR